jgi:hypothetical protein
MGDYGIGKSVRDFRKEAEENPNAKRIEMQTAAWLLKHYGEKLPPTKIAELKKILGMEGGKRRTKRRHTKKRKHTKRRHTKKSRHTRRR